LKSDYQRSVLFNGTNSAAMARVQAELPAGASFNDFSAYTFRGASTELDDEVHAGDEVFIGILTHGSPTNPSDPSHSHCVEYGVVEQGKDCLSQTEVNALIIGLEAIGAKVTVLDDSCFSGASIALANSNACILTVSDRYQESFATASDAFWKSFKIGLSPEQVFLQFRKSYQF